MQHSDERSVEPLAFAIRLRPIRCRARLLDAQRQAEFIEKRKRELSASVRMNALRDSESRNPRRVQRADDCCGALDIDGYCLGPTG